MKIIHSLEVVSCIKKVLNDATLNDVQFVVGKEKKVFHASSFLLASRSPVFKAMFYSSESKEPHATKQVIELLEANPEIFFAFLEYVITGEIHLTGQVIWIKKLYFFRLLIL